MTQQFYIWIFIKRSQNSKMKIYMTWLVWLSGLSASLRTKGSPVQFLIRAHTWVAGQVSSRGHGRGNHTLMFLSFPFSLSSPLSKNKQNLFKKRKSICISDLLWYPFYSHTHLPPTKLTPPALPHPNHRQSTIYSSFL